MTRPLWTNNLDFQIDKIYDIHRFRFVKDFKWSDYKSVRSYDGLVLCTSGSAVYIWSDRTMRLEKGQMVFLSARDAYTVKNIESEQFCHYTCNFTLSCSQDDDGYSGQNMDILQGNIHIPTMPQNNMIYRDLFESALSAWENRGPGYLLLVKSYLYRILYQYILEAENILCGNEKRNRLLPLEELLASNSINRYTIPELAEMCGLSVTHFRRLFRTQYGCAPAEYCNRKRLEHAKKLLATGEYSVTCAAQECGIHNVNYFCRLFKAENGITPLEYIRLLFAQKLVHRYELVKRTKDTEYFFTMIAWKSSLKLILKQLLLLFTEQTVACIHCYLISDAENELYHQIKTMNSIIVQMPSFWGTDCVPTV